LRESFQLALEATVCAAATAATGANFEGRIVVALSFAPFGSPVFKPDLRSNPRRHRLPGRHVGIAIPGEGRLQRLQLTTAELESSLTANRFRDISCPRSQFRFRLHLLLLLHLASQSSGKIVDSPLQSFDQAAATVGRQLAIQTLQDQPFQRADSFVSDANWQVIIRPQVVAGAVGIKQHHIGGGQRSHRHIGGGLGRASPAKLHIGQLQVHAEGQRSA
uniref:Heat shock protein n=1 Tax=Macrostomum lignano TaxID=282301 RepID=A0A1I8IQT0_9PLAT